MSRYLTPSKIGLLALIAIYTEGVVPSSATISVLSFLSTHILTKSSSSHTVAQADTSLIISVEDFQKATARHVSGIPGRTVWDLLLNKLWKINSLDGLHQFFDNVSCSLSPAPDISEASPDESPRPCIKLSRVSPLGTFVRRAQIEFTRLQFHDGVALWNAFIAFRSPSLSQWKKRHSSAGRLSFDANLDESSPEAGAKLSEVVYGHTDGFDDMKHRMSSSDIERLLERQVDQMQRSGGRLPPEIRERLHQMFKDGITIPIFSYYVDFLDSWKAGDYPSSFDSLHRYFDYTMHNKDRAFYQYALLNLALLHADFGCHFEALRAVEETISVARDNNDMTCLNYSLSWLYQYGKSHPELMEDIKERGMLGNEREALTFLKSKAKETQMWSLLSTSLLSEAKELLAQGEDVSQAFENCIKAAHINLTKPFLGSVGPQMMMQVSLFNRLGLTFQAALTREIYHQCYASHSPARDVLYSACNGANLLAQRGRCKDATAQLEAIDHNSVRSMGIYALWAMQLGLLRLRLFILRDRLNSADESLSQLKANMALGHEFSFEIAMTEIELHIRRKNYSLAMEVLEKLASDNTHGHTDTWCQIKLMTTKARIYDKAGIAPKGFSIALRAASLAWKSKAFPLLWEAVNGISAVFIAVKEFEASAKLLESTLPQVLECENCDLASRSFSLLADAYVGMAGQALSGSAQRKERLSRAMEYIDRAFEQDAQSGDVTGQCEMMAKKATIMHLNGDPALANDCAAKYLAIKQASQEHV